MLGIGFEEDKVNIDYDSELIHKVYSSVSIGKQMSLHQFANNLVYDELFPDEKIPLTFSEFSLKNIANGVSIAFVLPKLKALLKGMNNVPALTERELVEFDNLKPKDKLTSKQQIALLNQLGVFDLEIFEQLSAINKGKLFSYILNRDEKNITEYIRNRDMPKNNVSMDAYFVNTPENLKKINELLTEVGLIK